MEKTYEQKKAELNSAMIELLKKREGYAVNFSEGTYVTLEFFGEQNKEELIDIYTSPQCDFKKVYVHSTPQSSHTEYTAFTDFSNEEMEMLLDLCKKQVAKKRVWVLTISDVYDFQGYPHAPRVFTDKDKAINALYKEYEDAKKMLKKNGNDDWMEDEFHKGDMCFSMWPDGEWGTSHYDGRVDEVEVEE